MAQKIKTHQSHVKSPETENDEVVKLWKDETKQGMFTYILPKTHLPLLFMYSAKGEQCLYMRQMEVIMSTVLERRIRKVPSSFLGTINGGCKNGARFAMLFVSSEVGTLDHKWLGL
ncbi:hypothetical protein AFUB_048460 [Aspergillus fumigatus A1163]|uniref:Uncharacterized protein n=1 Tax=Aspergillus fumigatus (strain CBS 144.89 / FGSC A1163 / CEA10) TaxID=451804 RepID=B0XXI6_ASPFC|nr:hypothetical protein AFUB_048460 [Aspergillus fumigatus A1163]